MNYYATDYLLQKIGIEYFSRIHERAGTIMDLNDVMRSPGFGNDHFLNHLDGYLKSDISNQLFQLPPGVDLNSLMYDLDMLVDKIGISQSDEQKVSRYYIDINADNPKAFMHEFYHQVLAQISGEIKYALGPHTFAGENLVGAVEASMNYHTYLHPLQENKNLISQINHLDNPEKSPDVAIRILSMTMRIATDSIKHTSYFRENYNSENPQIFTDTPKLNWQIKLEDYKLAYMTGLAVRSALDEHFGKDFRLQDIRHVMNTSKDVTQLSDPIKRDLISFSKINSEDYGAISDHNFIASQDPKSRVLVEKTVALEDELREKGLIK